MQNFRLPSSNQCIVISLLMLAVSLIACAMQQGPAALTPPFSDETISVQPNPVWYGDSCGEDQPQTFTVSANLVNDQIRLTSVMLRWQISAVDGASGPQNDVDMTHAVFSGLFEVSVTVDTAAADAVLHGNNGVIEFHLFVDDNENNFYGFAAPMIGLWHCEP